MQSQRGRHNWMTFTHKHLYTHISSITLTAFLACVLKKSAPGIGKPFVTQCKTALQKDGCLKLPLVVSMSSSLHSPLLLRFLRDARFRQMKTKKPISFITDKNWTGRWCLRFAVKLDCYLISKSVRFTASLPGPSVLPQAALWGPAQQAEHIED